MGFQRNIKIFDISDIFIRCYGLNDDIFLKMLVYACDLDYSWGNYSKQIKKIKDCL